MTFSNKPRIAMSKSCFMAVLRGPQHIFELKKSAYLKLIGQRELIGKSVRPLTFMRVTISLLRFIASVIA